ncbi:MAG: LPS export ABC transporter ATP-binding protein [Spirochaetaceae bacterium]|nr:LPS export ABC transporter ATP-binding protein [Spirochaetaceae bacterium]
MSKSRSEMELKVEGLKKSFGKKEAVKDMSFTMKKGEIVGLLGPNGAGKTTCFYMIAGFIRPTAGKIFLNDKEITHDPMYRRALNGISYLPQDASVFRKLTVEKNVWSILETRKDLSQSDKKELLESLLLDLGIVKVRKQKAFTLSGGERRRTEIARSLACNPQFLLLDEPFAGIDPIAVFEIKRIVEHLSDRGIGVLITDHNVRDTLEITERSYITNLGEIIVSGSKDDVLKSELARKIYLGHDFEM